MHRSEITAVVNLHREGPAAVPSIRSAIAAVRDAQSNGNRCELLFVLDRSDDLTADVVRSATIDVDARSIEIDVGDLGLARNAAMSAVSSQYVAFLDADDLWGHQWLDRAIKRAASLEEDAVLHPAKSLIFGDVTRVVHHPDSDNSAFDIDRLRLHNAWTALCFAPADLVRQVPYPRNRLGEGFGFEDWSWNIEILRRGIHHLTVPETIHLIRFSGGNDSLKTRSKAALRTEWTMK